MPMRRPPRGGTSQIVATPEQALGPEIDSTRAALDGAP
jgi:hypothetical protein